MRVPFAVAAIALAAPTWPSTPVEWQRRGDAAWAAQDFDGAATCYSASAEAAPDPGLVAFNLGVLALQADDARAAELHFRAALSDRDAPPERVRQAEYNLGLSLLTRGGPAVVYAAAVAANERCLALTDAPGTLRADATHNLELAKLLLAVAAERDRATPPPPATAENPSPEASSPETSPAPAEVARNGNDPSSPTGDAVRPKATLPKQIGATTPGRGTLPTPPDDERLPPLSPEDARAVLQVQAARLARDRAASADLVAGQGGTHALDW
jgi:tetratricopeptide (TPR) repeat protein